MDSPAFDIVRAAAHHDAERARASWLALVGRHGDEGQALSAVMGTPAARLVPLVGSRADQLGLTQAARTRIARITERTAAVNQQLCLQAGPLLAGLRGAGVDVMALKGLALLGDVHPDRRLRRLGDLDLLVRVDDVESAIDVLRRCGYVAPRATARALRWGLHAVNLANPTRTSVDLHVRPAHAFPFRHGRSAAAWSTAEAVPADHPLSSVGLLRPSPVEHALVLAAHLARPAHEGIVHPWVDLHLLLTRHPAFASTEASRSLLAAARRERVSLRVGHVLERLSAELGTPLPVDVAELVDVGPRDRRAEERAIEVEERFARYERGSDGGLRKLVDLSRIPTTGERWTSRAIVAAGEIVATMAVHPDGMGARLRRTAPA